jgi:predicted dehydrogenase
MGCIGVGGQGKQVMRSLMGQPGCRMLAVCDVDAKRLNGARDIVNAQYGNQDCATYGNFRELLAREDIDAVLIATPDQWHVLQSIEAARAGKDIYLEKPLGLSVQEDIALRRAIYKYERVFQFGTQQRSDRNFRFACELVRNGRIGKLQRIIAATPASRAVDSYRPSPVPSDLDYDMWVGPARWMPYTQGVMGSCGNWGHVSNFSLGWVTTWGIHHVDIAQWGNNADTSGPVEVEGTGVFPKDGLYDCAVAWDMTLKYANGVTLNFVDNKKRKQGVLFEGSDGWVFVERGSIDAQPKSLLNEKIGSDGIHLPVSNDHSQNFLDCVRTRTTPVSSIEAAVRSDTVCHLSDIAMRLGRKLNWNPAAERFIDDEQANRMLTRSMRAPWHI